MGVLGQQTTHTSSGKLEDIVGEVFRESGSPAGLEVITGCGVKESRVLTMSANSVEEGLNKLVQSEKALSWSKGNSNSYRATIRYSPEIRLTSIRIPAKHIEARTVLLATDALLTDPSVLVEITKLGYKESSGELGFSQIRQQKRVIDLPAGTLGDDLMVLAEEFGPSVWELDQRTCGETQTFRINWIRR